MATNSVSWASSGRICLTTRSLRTPAGPLDTVSSTRAIPPSPSVAIGRYLPSPRGAVSPLGIGASGRWHQVGVAGKAGAHHHGRGADGFVRGEHARGERERSRRRVEQAAESRCIGGGRGLV